MQWGGGGAEQNRSNNCYELRSIAIYNPRRVECKKSTIRKRSDDCL